MGHGGEGGVLMTPLSSENHGPLAFLSQVAPAPGPNLLASLLLLSSGRAAPRRPWEC